MPRRNNRPHSPQQRRVRNGTPPPPALDQLVLPKGRCGTKLRFAEADVEKALEQAQAARARKGHSQAETRTYECPRCGDWHLTSRETYTERGQG